MTTFRTALTRLSELSVSGVINNYDINAIPEALTRTQLPALLVMPVDTQDDRLFKERGEGFQTVAFGDGARTVTYSVTHLLLVAPLTTGAGIRSHLPTLITAIDTYLDAIAADVTLNGALLEPARIRVETGLFKHGGVEYYGCAFRHLWLMAV